MSDSADLRKLLASWPFDPENDARVIKGDDGQDILQVRTPVGIEQLEMQGRPDGARPHGKESALEFYAEKLENARKTGKENDFELSPSDCAELFAEGTLYYFRYVRLFQLRDWAGTIRDTVRNLRAFDLIHEHARREEDQNYLEKWRPYILRINACAATMQALETSGYEKAKEIVDAAIQKIQALDELEEETFQFERDRSLTALRELAEQIEKNRPISELEKLEKQLKRAIDRQEFEQAARLRDRIKELRKPA